jgi:hypothetical protein
MPSIDYWHLWSVIGPLLVAAFGAIWARKIQLQDRHAVTLEKDKEFERNTKERAIDERRRITKEHYEKIEEALISLIVSGDMYQAALNAAAVEPTQGEQEKIAKHAESFTRAHAVVSLFAPPPISQAATKFARTCQDIAEAVPGQHDSKTLEVSFGTHKAALLASTQAFLAAERAALE